MYHYPYSNASYINQRFHLGSSPSPQPTPVGSPSEAPTPIGAPMQTMPMPQYGGPTMTPYPSVANGTNGYVYMLNPQQFNNLVGFNVDILLDTGVYFCNVLLNSVDSNPASANYKAVSITRYIGGQPQTLPLHADNITTITQAGQLCPGGQPPGQSGPTSPGSPGIPGGGVDYLSQWLLCLQYPNHPYCR